MPTNTRPSAGSGIDSDYEKPRDFFWGYFLESRSDQCTATNSLLCCCPMGAFLEFPGGPASPSSDVRVLDDSQVGKASFEVPSALLSKRAFVSASQLTQNFSIGGGRRRESGGFRCFRTILSTRI